MSISSNEQFSINTNSGKSTNIIGGDFDFSNGDNLNIDGSEWGSDYDGDHDDNNNAIGSNDGIFNNDFSNDHGLELESVSSNSDIIVGGIIDNHESLSDDGSVIGGIIDENLSDDEPNNENDIIDGSLSNDGSVIGGIIDENSYDHENLSEYDHEHENDTIAGGNENALNEFLNNLKTLT
jgi:hypothetical protein